MPHEIERKFLVTEDGWRDLAGRGRVLRQGYLAHTDRAVVRLRIEDGERAVMTIKSAGAGLARKEFEYPIPLADAEALIALAEGSELTKTRFVVPHAGRNWEVDVYSGDNDGLVIAEIELESEDQEVELPGWVGREVTGEAAYYAAHLSRHPFVRWQPGEDV